MGKCKKSKLATHPDTHQWLTIKNAAQTTGYSSGYISRLAREGKITVQVLDEQRLVDLTSLTRYAEDAKLENEVRNRQLSGARKRERQITVEVEQCRSVYLARSQTFEARALAAGAGTLALGLAVGLAGFLLWTWQPTVAQQAAVVGAAAFVPAPQAPLRSAEIASLDQATGVTEQAATGGQSYQLVWVEPGANPSATSAGVVRLMQQPDGSYVLVKPDGTLEPVSPPVIEGSTQGTP